MGRRQGGRREDRTFCAPAAGAVTGRPLRGEQAITAATATASATAAAVITAARQPEPCHLGDQGTAGAMSRAPRETGRSA